MMGKKVFPQFAVALVIALAAGTLLWASSAQAVKIIDLGTGQALADPAWVISPFSPVGGTVINPDPQDSTNVEIQLAPLNFGGSIIDTQEVGLYGAGIELPDNGGAGYRLEFTTKFFTPDSYSPDNGFYDGFAVNLNNTDFLWNQVNGGDGALGDPIVVPDVDPAGTCVGSAGVATVSGDPCVSGTFSVTGETWAWGGTTFGQFFATNAGTYTMTLEGAGPMFATVGLDTATTPDSDIEFASFGSINPLSDVPPPTVPPEFVPEPGTILFLAFGLLAVGGYERRIPNCSKWRPGFAAGIWQTPIEAEKGV